MVVGSIYVCPDKLQLYETKIKYEKEITLEIRQPKKISTEFTQICKGSISAMKNPQETWWFALNKTALQTNTYCTFRWRSK